MSNQFKKILIPIDDSKNSLRALNKAVSIASSTGSTVTVVHVISYHGAVAKIVGPYKGTLLNHVTKFLNHAKKYAEKFDVQANVQILYGNPGDQLLKFSKEKKFDLVVVGRRGTSKITGPSLGSVSNGLVQNSKIPVMVVT